MKRLLTLLMAILFTAYAFSQSPEKMSYQAVIRNSSNALVANTQIGMRISILQGSASGTAVYSETQKPSTNANGLVSIEIGGEKGFEDINWSAGPYFIKTETDPAGGTSYTISGTSQLLTVPYALHAKTAEKVTGPISEADPIYKGSEAANITATDITNLSNLSGSNTGDQNLSTLATKKALTDSTAKVRSEIPAKHYIGENYGGGKVFYVYDNGQHGLIAATADQSTEIKWYNGTNRYTGTIGDGLYAGAMNTAMVVSTQMADNQTGNFAAKVCADYSVTVSGVTYGDWYLPSKYELNLLYLRKTAVGGFASGYYWSSTEFNINLAWLQVFGDGSQSYTYKDLTLYVRAVRAF